MGIFIFLVVVCLGIPFLGWVVGGAVGGFFDNIFGTGNRSTYVDKSIHHHYNFHTHNHEHKNLTVIDEETHRKGLKYFSDKKDSRNG